jgi:hypothetical protein
MTLLLYSRSKLPNRRYVQLASFPVLVCCQGTTAWSLFRVKEQVAAESGELIVTYTVILYLHDETWRIVHAQQSIGVPASQARALAPARSSASLCTWLARYVCGGLGGTRGRPVAVSMQLEELDGTTFSSLSRTPHLRSGSSAGSGKVRHHSAQHDVPSPASNQPLIPATLCGALISFSLQGTMFAIPQDHLEEV